MRIVIAQRLKRSPFLFQVKRAISPQTGVEFMALGVMKFKFLAYCTAVLAATNTRSVMASKKPNIVIILTDDVGFVRKSHIIHSTIHSCQSINAPLPFFSDGAMWALIVATPQCVRARRTSMPLPLGLMPFYFTVFIPVLESAHLRGQVDGNLLCASSSSQPACAPGAASTNSKTILTICYAELAF